KFVVSELLINAFISCLFAVIILTQQHLLMIVNPTSEDSTGSNICVSGNTSVHIVYGVHEKLYTKKKQQPKIHDNLKLLRSFASVIAFDMYLGGQLTVAALRA
ncbi:hypothetical protein ABVT39_012890, partial [Epinephelus coioides]